jgi:hypothetical protein
MTTLSGQGDNPAGRKIIFAGGGEETRPRHDLT